MASIDNFYAIYLILNFILYEKEEIIMSINKCRIAGIVAEEPKICKDEFYKEGLEIVLDIDRYDIHKFERIKCVIVDKELIAKAQDSIGVGDYLMATGRLACFEYVGMQAMKCPHCGEESMRRRRAKRTDIILDDFEVSPGSLSPDSVGINSVSISGVIPNPIKSNLNHTWFSVANNRPKVAQEILKDLIIEKVKSGTGRLNLIYVHGFNRIAEIMNNSIHQKDRIIVSGYISEHLERYEIPFRCKRCGEYSDQYFEYPIYVVIARSVKQDLDYIPSSNATELNQYNLD